MAGKLPRALAALGLLLFVALAIWATWSLTGRVSPLPADSAVTPAHATALGKDSGRGNFIAVQPWATPRDYASAAALSQKLDGYLTQAQTQGWLNPATIAVFPEYIGTWLVAAGEKESIFTADTVASAMTTVALTHLPSFAWYMFKAPSLPDTARWALFTAKSERMARDYEAVFGGLSQKFGVHIVAGSIVLPAPTLVGGKLHVQPGGAMANVSALFGPDGKIIPPLVIKSRLIDEEQAFSVAGRAQDIPVFDTPAGKLGVLICADSWYPAAYANLQKQGASLIAVPSYVSGNDSWRSPWMGYNGAPTEKDVAASDIGQLTEGQAWLKYAMAGRAPAHGVRQGINVFLRGDLWDLGSDGATVALQDGKTVVGNMERRAVLTNLWLQ